MLKVEIKLLNIVKDENLANNFKLVQFFSTSNPPLNIVRQTYGFVEELVDFKRSDKDAENIISIQEGFLKLRRKLAKTVTKRGGNTVISYR